MGQQRAGREPIPDKALCCQPAFELAGSKQARADESGVIDAYPKIVFGLLRRDDVLSGSTDAIGQSLAVCTQRELRSEEHTSELQSLMRISYAVFCLKKKKQNL